MLRLRRACCAAQEDTLGELGGARTSHSHRRRSTSLARLESASVLITYSPLDAFEAMSEGAALMHGDGLAASLHTCAASYRVLILLGLL